MAGAEYMPALWIPHAAWGYPQGTPGRNGNRLRYVIIHSTAGQSSAEDVAYYFQRGADGRQTGTHFVVGRDGTVVQCVRVDNAAWGNGAVEPGAEAWWVGGPNPNLLTVSIEHVKPHTDNSDTITEAQKLASFRLVAWLCAGWGIPARPADGEGGITGHFSMQPQSRARCPGPYPWDELYAFLSTPPDGVLR